MSLQSNSQTTETTTASNTQLQHLQRVVEHAASRLHGLRQVQQPQLGEDHVRSQRSATFLRTSKAFSCCASSSRAAGPRCVRAAFPREKGGPYRHPRQGAPSAQGPAPAAPAALREVAEKTPRPFRRARTMHGAQSGCQRLALLLRRGQLRLVVRHLGLERVAVALDQLKHGHGLLQVGHGVAGCSGGCHLRALRSGAKGRGAKFKRAPAFLAGALRASDVADVWCTGLRLLAFETLALLALPTTALSGAGARLTRRACVRTGDVVEAVRKAMAQPLDVAWNWLCPRLVRARRGWLQWTGNLLVAWKRSGAARRVGLPRFLARVLVERRVPIMKGFSGLVCGGAVSIDRFSSRGAKCVARTGRGAPEGTQSLCAGSFC